MVKMHPLKKSAADRRAEEDAMGSAAVGRPENQEDREGPVVHLDHHHLKAMKVGELRHGDGVTFHGAGHVEHAETTSGEHGERRSARIRMTDGALEHDAKRGDEREGLRNEIEAMHGKAEDGRAEREKLKAAKSGKQVAEQKAG